MFERCAHESREIIAVAWREALKADSSHIEPEHLLFAIIEQENGTARQLLGEQVCRLISSEVRDGFTIVSGYDEKRTSELSHSGKRVLDYGAEEAERLNMRRIGVEHLLMGLLREHESTTGCILGRHGVTRQTITLKIQESLSSVLYQAGGQLKPAREVLHNVVTNLPDDVLVEPCSVLASFQNWPRAPQGGFPQNLS